MKITPPIRVLLVTVAVCIPVLGLSQQQPGGNQQVQSVGSSDETAQAPEEGQGAAVSAPLLGVEGFTAGSLGERRSYVQPSLQIFEMGDSNFSLGPGGRGFETESTVLGRLAMQHVDKRNQVTMDYLGGGTFFSHHSNLNYTMHQFGVTEAYQGRRWGLILDDRATYLPESPFGYAGFGWGGSLGLGLGGALGSNLAPLNSFFNPAQSLITGRGSQVMNAATAQVSYSASPRSTFTFAGSYGLLHFRTPGSIDSRNAVFLGGYNRNITARDTIGLSYGYTMFQFPDLHSSFATHLVQLSYGHRVTGRLAVAASGGAQLTAFPAKLAGSSTTAVSWVANGSLNYSVSRNSFSLAYSRYTTNGAGVFIGAETQYLYFNWSRQLTRNWVGSLGPGYSRTQNLQQTTAGKGQFTYDSVYGGGNLSRALGRYTTMFFGYNLQTQRFQTGTSVSGVPSSSLLRHVVTFGFDWHPRQMVVD